MSQASVALTIGGQVYRVRSQAPEHELRKLAAHVDERLRSLTGSSTPVAPQALLLVAISLAHDLELERTQRKQLQHVAQDSLELLLERIDTALQLADQSIDSIAREKAT
jgi:cell division protein ZapA